jgi:hypothetical protein
LNHVFCIITVWSPLAAAVIVGCALKPLLCLQIQKTICHPFCTLGRP